jgi:hypothetical protein
LDTETTYSNSTQYTTEPLCAAFDENPMPLAQRVTKFSTLIGKNNWQRKGKDQRVRCLQYRGL